MNDRDTQILPPIISKALVDKMVDKRRSAALQIEKLCRDYQTKSEEESVVKLIIKMKEFCSSFNQNVKKGGFIGLSSIALGLGTESKKYTVELLKPILTVILDPDPRVKYHGLEAILSIVKCVRGDALILMDEIFLILSELVADSDGDVRAGAENLDRTIKDLVDESHHFVIEKFLNLIKKHSFPENPSTRQFIVSWISHLHNLPTIDIIIYLPFLLDQLFIILSDPRNEISCMCSKLLKELNNSVKNNPEKINFSSLVNILVTHSCSNQEEVQYTALKWLEDFINIAGSSLVPLSSGILAAILPKMASKGRLKAVTESLNINLMSVICNQKEGVDHEILVKVLNKQLQEKETSDKVKLACLTWYHQLFCKIPSKILCYFDENIQPILMKLLKSSDEVVTADLHVLVLPFQSPLDSESVQVYFNTFMITLVENFASDTHFLDEKGPFIIKQLCSIINPEIIFSSFSQILKDYKDLGFAYKMVKLLNRILLTYSELHELRSQLRDLKKAENYELFCSLFKTWCHSPVATIALCLLTSNYKSACDVLKKMGDFRVTFEFLKEIDQLVQLIESPVYARLRLELLETEKNGDLLKSLYGLLMLLPQGDAFFSLQRRLQCVPFSYCQTNNTMRDNSTHPDMDFKELIAHFHETQMKHEALRKLNNI